jgi:hypothetical protein
MGQARRHAEAVTRTTVCRGPQHFSPAVPYLVLAPGRVAGEETGMVIEQDDFQGQIEGSKVQKQGS